MVNIVLGMSLQLLLMLLRKHLYLWLFHPDRLTFIFLLGTCTLAKDKTTSIYADSRYAFRVVHDFVMLY